MELIDREELKTAFCDSFCPGEFCQKGTCKVIEVINKEPTVDAVPVVRCENCVCYREPDDDHAYCTNHLRETEGDDYCSYGIRKDWEHGTD